MSKCKVCQSELKTQIDRQLLAGSNLSYLAQWCSERNLTLSVASLKRHAQQHLKGWQEPKLTAETKPSHCHQLADQEEGLNIICFEAYCHSIGLNPADFKDLELNIEKVIYGSQKALSLLFFKNCAAVDFKLTQHLSDRAGYPLEQIRGLRSVFEMYAKVTGIDIMINENAAIKMLENSGYTITKNTIDIDVKT